MAAALDISVVIPTRERFGALERTLDALAAQELGAVRAEVVVVDNGSRDGSLDRLHARASRWTGPGDLVVLEEPTPGAAAARNAGIARARGRRVLFLGDDCRPVDVDFVAGHARGAGAVLGKIEWDPSVEVTPVMRWLASRGHIVDYGRIERASELGPWAFYTGNVSLERDAVIDVAGFDERFRGYGWEDLDLALRLFDRGLSLEYRPELLVHHAHRYGVDESLSRMEAVGRGRGL